AITEPVPLYLLEACGFYNKTPKAFSEAVEEGSDVSPRDLQQMLSILADGSVRILAYNEQTNGPETRQMLEAAKRAGIAAIPVRETLPAGEHYVAWMRGYLTQIQDALAA
ncbi:MAG: transporter solute binding protein, partial [Jatrophihabitantaceae bacterium]|nr:transporter solute binding protein [Jatrophihabitantaceae bacterium]